MIPKNFYIIARGSMQESKTWLTKALRRNLISEVEYKELLEEWNSIHFKMIYFIKKHSRLKENK
ncbi:four helix bundle protein [uncultured Proteiniphilum sp.]|uniref:four helix bundle protein n=1 Tax=uncultured Proteiniphilum sp. TaxID=497637 RepID=UPI00344FC251